MGQQTYQRETMVFFFKGFQLNMAHRFQRSLNQALGDGGAVEIRVAKRQS